MLSRRKGKVWTETGKKKREMNVTVSLLLRKVDCDMCLSVATWWVGQMCAKITYGKVEATRKVTK